MEKFNEYVLLLNLPCPFTESELKRQYKFNLLKNHPDKNIDNQEEATEKTKNINEAFTFLHTFVESKDNTSEIPAERCSDMETNEDILNHFGKEYWSIWNDFLYSYLESQNASTTNANRNKDRRGNEGDQNKSATSPHDYVFSICSSFVQSISLDYSNIASKCKEVLSKLDKKATKVMLDLIFSYSSFAKFPENVAIEVKDSLRTVAEEMHNIVIIIPTMQDLFDDNVYVYEKNSEKYFVPLWHHEVVYSIAAEDNKELIVKCTPDVPDNVLIDEDNNLHIDVSWKATSLLASASDDVEYNIANKTFSIHIQNILLKKHQKVILPNCGISVIDPQDIYNNSTKSDVIFHISLS